MMRVNPELLDPDAYPHSMTMPPRFSDLDVQHHVNNARVAEFYQEARLSFYAHLEKAHGFKRPAGARTLVAHLSIDYLAEVPYPDPVELRVGVLSIGRTSHTLAIALLSQGRCAGLAKAVLVNADAVGPAPLPATLRELLGQYMLRTETR